MKRITQNELNRAALSFMRTSREYADITFREGFGLGLTCMSPDYLEFEYTSAGRKVKIDFGANSAAEVERFVILKLRRYFSHWTKKFSPDRGDISVEHQSELIAHVIGMTKKNIRFVMLYMVLCRKTPDKELRKLLNHGLSSGSMVLSLSTDERASLRVSLSDPPSAEFRLAGDWTIPAMQPAMYGINHISAGGDWMSWPYPAIDLFNGKHGFWLEWAGQSGYGLLDLCLKLTRHTG